MSGVSETQVDTPDAPEAEIKTVLPVGATIILQVSKDGKGITVTAFGQTVTLAEG